jgi:hypothetical protein
VQQLKINNHVFKQKLRKGFAKQSNSIQTCWQKELSSFVMNENNRHPLSLMGGVFKALKFERL